MPFRPQKHFSSPNSIILLMNQTKYNALYSHNIPNASLSNSIISEFPRKSRKPLTLDFEHYCQGTAAVERTGHRQTISIIKKTDRQLTASTRTRHFPAVKLCPKLHATPTDNSTLGELFFLFAVCCPGLSCRFSIFWVADDDNDDDDLHFFVQQYAVDLATRVQGCQPHSALNAPGIDQD
ncbi:uncharacterized protein LOC131800885 [Musca domestica]|uniref:Uncharacterized protein LOC131800885 n=1 Tax=Musca domestica TaxID=7370 RepID=A0ABM3UMG9_MUSDO|nr:uncharacterized protein LOC131800885 [Musca domestica]